MMSMTFEASSSVTLLFDFWAVHGPAGMVLSVIIVLLLTVLFEFLKMWRIWLCNSSQLAPPKGPFSSIPPVFSPACSSDECPGEGSVVLESSPSESSLAPIHAPSNVPNMANGWLLHGVQTGLHVLQVGLGYMLMLCVMSYNVWIFLGVIVGSVLGYFLSNPFIMQM